MSKFYVLLAGDNAGKSTVLNYFLEHRDWQIASYDAVNVPEPYKIIRDIDDTMETHTLKHFPNFSQDFKSSLYATYIYYLRDQVQKKLENGNVLCNSYYYKILAKDILQGGDNPRFHPHWRKLEQPDLVIFLDTPPEVAARRLPSLDALFENEFYDSQRTYESFVRFQHDLRKQMLHEIKHLPTAVIDGTQSVSEISAQLAKIVSS